MNDTQVSATASAVQAEITKRELAHNNAKEKLIRVVNDAASLDMTYSAKRAQRVFANMTLLEKGLMKVLVKHPNLEFYINDYRCEITCRDRESTVTALTAFGYIKGVWKRQASDWNDGSIVYVKSITNKFGEFFSLTFDLQVRGQPPISCKIVEVEEVVPSYTRKVKKVVCGDKAKDVATVEESQVG